MTAEIASSAITKRKVAADPSSSVRDRKRGKIVGQDRLPAPFSLRCGAFLIDYVLLAGTVALSTIFSRLIGGGVRTAGAPSELFGLLAAAIVGIMNFGVLTGFTGRSVGKWATGLKIHRRNGQPLSLVRSFIRHFVGYPLSLLTLGLGFLIAALNSEGRALHDVIAGTLVTRDTNRSERIAPRE